MSKKIKIDGKVCTPMKCVKSANFGSNTVLTDSCWEYVSLFLERKSKSGLSDPQFYWDQAHSYYLASLSLPDSARPLTSYYCILNASKALLRIKGVPNDRLKYHGLTGTKHLAENTSFSGAVTQVKKNGVLPELANYFDDLFPENTYNISDLMYNIPCIHRAHCITFKRSEIFIPINNLYYIVDDDSTDAWLSFVIDDRYADLRSLRYIPSVFNKDEKISDAAVFRMNEQFEWDSHKNIAIRKNEIAAYNSKIRKYIYYINGKQRLWYLKKNTPKNSSFFQVSSPTLIFAVFHRLSELVRYDPRLFYKYMKSKYNWLLHEFIRTALDQFIDEISCEITGMDIMCRGYR